MFKHCKEYETITLQEKIAICCLSHFAFCDKVIRARTTIIRPVLSMEQLYWHYMLQINQFYHRGRCAICRHFSHLYGLSIAFLRCRVLNSTEQRLPTDATIFNLSLNSVYAFVADIKHAFHCRAEMLNEKCFNSNNNIELTFILVSIMQLRIIYVRRQLHGIAVSWQRSFFPPKHPPTLSRLNENLFINCDADLVWVVCMCANQIKKLCYEGQFIVALNVSAVHWFNGVFLLLIRMERKDERP